MNKNALAIFFSIISFSLFSVMDASSRYILHNQLLDFITYYFFLKITTVLVFIFFGFLIYKKKFFIIKNKKIVLIRSVILFVNTICVTLSLKYLPLDLFYALVFLMPLVATLLSIPLLKEHLKLSNIIGIIIGFSGIIVALQPSSVDYSMDIIIGITLCAIVILTGALVGIIARKYLVNENPFTATFYPFLLATVFAVIMLTLGIGSDKITFNIPNLYISLIILIGATTAALASSLYMKAYQYGKSMYVAPIQYIQIIYGSFFGYWLFEDTIAITTILGVILIILGSFINNNQIMKTVTLNIFFN